MLRVEPMEAGTQPARLADYVWGGAEWDCAVHRVAGGARWVVRSRVQGARRDLRQFLVDPGGLRALDHTEFRIDTDGFAEVARYRTRGGTNLHAAPIRLPAAMSIGEAATPFPGVVVTVAFVGEARVGTPGDPGAGTNVVALRAEAGGRSRVQWLARGIGEFAIGEEGEPFERWMEAWTGGGHTWLETVPEALASMAMPELPREGHASPAGIF